MVKQLRQTTFFLALSYADWRWNELVSIISKLEENVLSEDEIYDLSYQDRYKLFNKKESMVDKYIPRPGLVFAAGKYSMVDQMCYAEYSRYCYLIYKSAHSDNQPEELTDNL